jgi:CBS domain-containing protein
MKMEQVSPDVDATGRKPTAIKSGCPWIFFLNERFLEMKRKVRDLMTGFSEIAVLDEKSTLFEAVLKIGIAGAMHQAALRCPAALVVDAERNVAGFLEFRNMLRGLEPRYVEFAEAAQKAGFSPERVRSELQKYGLWEDALEGLCKKAGETVIKRLMTVPEESRITDAEDSINEAIYQMIVAGKDYLFVRDGQALAGVISLSDILGHICDTVRDCRI